MFIRRRISKTLHSIKTKNHRYLFVRIRVSCQGNRVDLNTGISLTDEKQWNKKREEIKQGCNVNGISYSELNKTLTEYEMFVHQYFTDCEQMSRCVSLPELKSKFDDKFMQSNGNKRNEFFHLYDDFIAEQSSVKGWGQAMIEAHQRLRDKLKRFNSNLRLVDLSTSTMEKIKIYLSKTMYNDSLLKRLSYLKTFVKWAKEKKYVLY